MQITLLERERWKGHILPMPAYTAAEHYAVRMCAREKGAAVLLELQPLDPPLVFTPEAYGCPDRLYADHFEHARAYGIFDGGALAAAIEICPEEWNNRMRITELWVDEAHRRQGLGTRLIAFARGEAEKEGRRALVLETQSCNTGGESRARHGARRTARRGGIPLRHHRSVLRQGQPPRTARQKLYERQASRSGARRI